ncbi:hypothetical protein D3C86_2108180 [compost metagenome]
MHRYHGLFRHKNGQLVGQLGYGVGLGAYFIAVHPENDKYISTHIFVFGQMVGLQPILDRRFVQCVFFPNLF